MRALVTGGGGLLGGRITQMLAERGTPVTVLVRPSTDLRPLRGAQMRVVRGSLTDFATLKDAVRGATHVFHCAWLPASEGAPERAYFDVNVLGTGMLLEAARREPRLERFVHMSTTDVYGYPRQAGTEDLGLADSGLPQQRSRVQAEAAVWGFADEGVPVTVLRPATVFGPRSREAVIDIVRRLRQHRLVMVDGGRARGGFCYVDNVACAAISASVRPGTVGRAYNLTDGMGVTWREYVATLAAGLQLGRPHLSLPFVVAMAAARAGELAYAALELPGRPMLTRQAVLQLGRDREFRSDRVKGEIGDIPRVAFAEAMRRTVQWVCTVERQAWGEAAPAPRRMSGLPS